MTTTKNLPEASEEITALMALADIRSALGVGDKPMLSELAGIFMEREKAANARVAGLVEALTPSTDTKSAYIGEFTFSVELPDAEGEDGETRMVNMTVPWTTTKEIMKAIRDRAEHRNAVGGEGE